MMRRSLNRRSRRGVLALLALGCLAIVFPLVMSTVYAALRDARQMRRHENLEQTCRLLEGGALRAVAQLQAAAQDDSLPPYRGEVWDLASDQIAGKEAGQVVIQVSNLSATKPQVVTIVAKYPKRPGEIVAQTVQRTRTFTWNRVSPSNEE